MDFVLSYAPIGLSPTDGHATNDYDGDGLKKLFTPARILSGGFSANATYILNEPNMDRNRRLSFFTGPSFSVTGCYRACVGVATVEGGQGQPARNALTVGVGSPGITTNVSIGTCITNLRGQAACPKQ